MHFAPGSRLGPYEITAQIGQGGMGEVYRATDTSLKRQVAIKVLPSSLAGDPDRLARFQREAEVLAALNHPNIAAIHGLDRSDGGTALVMELVEGPTLADRIAQGALPFDEAMPIATQIAEALEAAHEQAIVHRDLKPANIKVRPDGTVKVLDFGLAKALDAAPRGTVSVATLPTITSPAMTQLGLILGTAAYMSPEQARGRTVDRRTDIWAFGCVLFEMLTGLRPFDGENVTEVLGAVIHKDVPWTRLPTHTPGHVRALLERCLQKDPKQRFRDIGDVRLALGGAFAAGATALPSLPAGGSGWSFVLVAGALALAATGASVVTWMARTPSPAPTVAFTVETGQTSNPASFAVSPNGQYLAFTQEDRGVQKLWIRALDATEARAIPGTEDASLPFWSPDSTRIGFFAGNLLKQVHHADGALQRIAETSASQPLGGTWNERDVILFARDGAGVFRVPAAGGEPHPVTTLQTGEPAHIWPAFLPGGEYFIYLKVRSGRRDLMWRALDSATERVIRSALSQAVYSPTGHLLFRGDDALVAQAFDPETGEVSGPTVQVAADPRWGGLTSAAFALSQTGVLAHRPGNNSGAVARLSWFDRNGQVVGTVGEPGDYRNAVLDRTGERVAANTLRDELDVWVIDLKRGATARVTQDPAADADPVFSPDGEFVAFYSARGSGGIYRRLANGTGSDELLAQTGIQSWPRDWSRDGRYLLYQKGRDLWVVPLEGDRKPFPYIATPALEQGGRFSPDVRWVAYSSDDTGRPEVIVQDFLGRGAKFPVSTGGGEDPRWSADGRELFYLDPGGRLMAVDVADTPGFSLGVPKPLFQTQLNALAVQAQRRFSVSPDGKRFLMNVPLEGSVLAPITVTVNWHSLLTDR